MIEVKFERNVNPDQLHAELADVVGDLLIGVNADNTVCRVMLDDRASERDLSKVKAAVKSHAGHMPTRPGR